MAKRKLNKEKGFTIVELVVVIIILGILAATALPRFIDVQDDAQFAVAEGVRGALVSAIGLAKAKYVAGGKVSPIDMDEDGTDDLVINTAGYPTDDGAGGGGLDQCAGIFAGALGAQAPAVITGTSAATTGTNALAEADARFTAGTEWYAVDNNATLATCDFVYLPETAATGAYAAQFTYTVATGVISAITVGTAP
ncbi:MAG: prepilin-type N-terminal cleavage/methylation domain-containing protein [Candidatus Azotimanducaceae bacterium]